MAALGPLTLDPPEPRDYASGLRSRHSRARLVATADSPYLVGPEVPHLPPLQGELVPGGRRAPFSVDVVTI